MDSAYSELPASQHRDSAVVHEGLGNPRELAAVVLIISLAFGLGGFVWRFPTLTNPAVLHPSIFLPFFQLAWLLLATVLAAKTLSWPRRRNRP